MSSSITITPAKVSVAYGANLSLTVTNCTDNYVAYKLALLKTAPFQLPAYGHVTPREIKSIPVTWLNSEKPTKTMAFAVRVFVHKYDRKPADFRAMKTIFKNTPQGDECVELKVQVKIDPPPPPPTLPVAAPQRKTEAKSSRNRKSSGSDQLFEEDDVAKMDALCTFLTGELALAKKGKKKTYESMIEHANCIKEKVQASIG